MAGNVPDWGLRKAVPGDRAAVAEALRLHAARLHWPAGKVVRSWAKRQGWPTPWLAGFGMARAFTARMLKDDASFDKAIRESGIKIEIPVHEHTLSPKRLQELDGLYAESSHWGILVEELREIRRAVEAGVLVKVEGGRELRNWQDFYDWAHGRYHALEDGADKWIGNDD